MTVRKKIWGFILIMVMLLSMNFQVFASDAKNNQVLVDTEYTITEAKAITRASMGEFTVVGSRVYPANTATGSYYSVYTDIAGGAQWCNGTLSELCATVYKQTGCNGFYVQANINAGDAKTYKLYSNGTLVGQGSVPSQYVNLSVMVENRNPGNWRLVLYKSGDTVGIPVWGNIYLE